MLDLDNKTQSNRLPNSKASILLFPVLGLVALVLVLVLASIVATAVQHRVLMLVEHVHYSRPLNLYHLSLYTARQRLNGGAAVTVDSHANCERGRMWVAIHRCAKCWRSHESQTV